MNKTVFQLSNVGKCFMLLAVFAILPASVFAKDNKKKGQKQEEVVAETTTTQAVDETPVITEECVTNVSLFSESAKNKQYADAVEPWYSVYNTCPNASVAIYAYGPKIIAWQLSQTNSEEEKAKLRNLLMDVYDKRIKYFGDNAKYPTPYILGQKALDYCDYFTGDSLKLCAYQWLKESVEGMGTKSSLEVVGKFAELSNALYKADSEKYGEQYIADYGKVSELLSTMSADPANKYAAYAKQRKDYIDNIFAISGAADCGKLDELYASVVNSSLQDLDMLTKIMKLYHRVDCAESSVYFTAAEASHKLKPTEESAAGCAKMCLKKEDYRGAIEYYEEATNYAETDDAKANYQYLIAYIYGSNIKNYPLSRQYARKSLEYKPDQGRCYLLIGSLYASSKPYDDAVMNKTVFWAACDKFAKAKQVDPSCAEEAQRLINTYSQYFPTTEEIFFNAGNGLAKGKAFTVGGWIGETTVCR